jgi:hypothetical protein
MSIEAMTLVLHHSQASGVSQMILMGIANHEGDGGAWPSIATLAKYGKVSERRVQQVIRELEAAGELTVHTMAGGTTPNGATNLYYVTLSCPAECDGTTNHRQGVKSGADRGETHFTPGVKPTSPKPSLEPSVKPYISSDFENFWNTYPRKVGKQAAIKAFTKAITIASVDEILAAAIRYGNDRNLPFDENFIPHPATWLNAGRWEDGPLPERKLSPEELALKGKALAEKRHQQTIAATQEILEQDKRAKETADAPKCEHGKIIAACMPCIRAGKV